MLSPVLILEVLWSSSGEGREQRWHKGWESETGKIYQVNTGDPTKTSHSFKVSIEKKKSSFHNRVIQNGAICLIDSEIDLSVK